MEKDIEILLVEDNPYDAELTIRALKQSKILNHIVHLSDGEEAIDYLFSQGKFKGNVNRNKPRVILLDLKLPKVSGLEVLKKIKEDNELRNIPVVMLTSSKEEKDIAESYKLGVNSYIVKPVAFDKFADAVRDLGLYWLLLNQTRQ